MKKGYAWLTDGEEVEERNGGLHISGNFLMMMKMSIQMLIQMCLGVRFDGTREKKFMYKILIELLKLKWND